MEPGEVYIPRTASAQLRRLAPEDRDSIMLTLDALREGLVPLDTASVYALHGYTYYRINAGPNLFALVRDISAKGDQSPNEPNAEEPSRRSFILVLVEDELNTSHTPPEPWPDPGAKGPIIEI